MENNIKNYNLSYVSQGNGGVKYIWPNIFIFDMENAPNLNAIIWDSCRLYNDNGEDKSNSDSSDWQATDTGGETFQYLLDNEKELKPKHLDNIHLTHTDNLKESHMIPLVKDEHFNMINDIFNLYNRSYLNKELLLKYDNKLTIFHLRGYTWSNAYKNIKLQVDDILKRYI